MAGRKLTGRNPAWISLLVLLFLGVAGTAEGQGPAPGGLEIGAAGQVIVYYFHGDRRCSTCREIERLSRIAVTEGFPEELAGGTIRFLSVNVDQRENRHFADEFRLYTRALILTEEAGGKPVRSSNLQRIWELVHNPSEFNAYVQGELRAFLKGPGQGQR